MLFQKSLTKELTYTSIGVFFILLAILLTTQSINLLGRAAQGRIANDAIAALIGFWTLGFFPVLMILTVFISTLVVFTRMWREHEMAVWLAAGKSLRDWIKPVMAFALPLSLLVALGTLVVEPWAQQRSKEYAEILKQREEMSALAPGVFKESKSSDRIYFIENYSVSTGATRNVFVQTIRNGEVSTVLAKEGKLGTDEQGNRTLTLKNGRYYVGEAGKGDFEVTEFQEYTIKISESPRTVTGELSSGEKDTLDLLQSQLPQDRAELAWRLSLPLCALILALLAIPLSYYNPRAGHAYNLMFALLAYLAYQNMLWLLRSWIASDKLPSALGILPAHLLMLALALALLHYRNRPATSLLAYLRAPFARKTS